MSRSWALGEQFVASVPKPRWVKPLAANKRGGPGEPYARGRAAAGAAASSAAGFEANSAALHRDRARPSGKSE